VQERSTAAVLREPANPAADLVAVEGWVEPHAALPWLAAAVVGLA
jgi:hypothetical protein